MRRGAGIVVVVVAVGGGGGGNVITGPLPLVTTSSFDMGVASVATHVNVHTYINVLSFILLLVTFSQSACYSFSFFFLLQDF
jgi:hypothetical protein